MLSAGGGGASHIFLCSGAKFRAGVRIEGCLWFECLRGGGVGRRSRVFAVLIIPLVRDEGDCDSGRFDDRQCSVI